MSGQLPSWGVGSIPDDDPRLSEVSTEALCGELIARLSSKQVTSGVAWDLKPFIDTAAAFLDRPTNRLSPRRIGRDFRGMCKALGDSDYSLSGKTVLDLGCGSWNPGGLSMLHIMLGATRAYAVDTSRPEHEPRAARALADLIAAMLLHPTSVVGGYAISRLEVLQNLRSFGVARLAQGDVAGIDGEKLCWRCADAADLPIRDGEVDLAVSHAFLEHVLEPDSVVGELSRVTSAGGFGVHLVDATDHRRYQDKDVHPLDYLSHEASNAAGDVTDLPGKLCRVRQNRVRPREWIAKFESGGFTVIKYEPKEVINIDDQFRKKFVSPYRNMSSSNLGEIIARITVRKN